MTPFSSNPLVSVIVRTKDRLDNFKQCLQSIIEQTYRPIEIVVVNDGGCDVSEVTNTLPLDISSQVLQLDHNVGRTRAANKGLDEATGEYLCFLDDDDLWHPDHLQTLAPKLAESALLRDNSLDAHTDTNAETSEGSEANTKPIGVVYSSTKAVEIDVNGQSHDLSVFETPFNALDLIKGNFIPIMSALFLRKWIDDGIRLDSQFDLYEDWDFWLQISQKCDFEHIPKITATYHLHENASGVHNQDLAEKAAIQIHQKWLPSLSTQQMAQLIQQTNKNHENRVTELQNNNQNQLNTIGAQHSQALNTIQEKDENINALEQAYKEAIHTLEAKDDDIDHLDSLYQNAIKVIEQKDANLTNLESLYKNAIETIETKDDNIEHLNTIYKHAINTIQGKDSDIERLQNENMAFATENVACQTKYMTAKKENLEQKIQIDSLQNKVSLSEKEVASFKTTLIWRLRRKIKHLLN